MSEIDMLNERPKVIPVVYFQCNERPKVVVHFQCSRPVAIVQSIGKRLEISVDASHGTIYGLDVISFLQKTI